MCVLNFLLLCVCQCILSFAYYTNIDWLIAWDRVTDYSTTVGTSSTLTSGNQKRSVATTEVQEQSPWWKNEKTPKADYFCIHDSLDATATDLERRLTITNTYDHFSTYSYRSCYFIAKRNLTHCSMLKFTAWTIFSGTLQAYFRYYKW